jgi:uncharacterized protein
MASAPPQALATVELRLTDVLRPAREVTDPIAFSRSRVQPSLAVAHATGKASVSCWIRARPQGRVAVLFGGGLAATVVGTGTSELPVDFPAGSRAARVTPTDAKSVLGRLVHWERLELALEPLASGEQGATGPQLEDLFALLPDRVVAVGVIARPLDRGAVQPLLDDLSDKVDALQPHAEGRGHVRLELERALEELRYLERWLSSGLWQMEVWVGSASPEESRAFAGMLGSCADLQGLMLSVRPQGAPSPAGTSAGSVWAPERAVGVDALGALMRAPVRELPGIRLADMPEFDLNPEAAGELELGSVLDVTRTPCIPFTVPLSSVNRHVFVTGATGSGKSQTVRALLEKLALHDVPWLVIEPAKAEYGRLAGRLKPLGKGLTVIRPGDVGRAPASLNPLEPSSILLEPNRREFFRLQTHLDLVRALFTAAFQADEPFPQILARALTMSYEERGWNVALGRSTEGDASVRPRFPSLADLQRCAKQAVDAVEYGTEVRNNVRGFVDVRLGSLRLGTPGRFFEDGHPLDLEALLRTHVVFEIEDLGDDNDKAFFIGTILVRVFETLRLLERHGKTGDELRHVTVIEEAHRLLRNVPPDSAAGHAVTMFADLLAEVRAYGEGIVVAEQIPAKIIPDVVKNSAVKIVHRLPSADDRAFVGATMNMTDRQSEAVVSFTPGMAALHVDGMDNPVLVSVDAANRTLESNAVPHLAPPLRMRSSSCPKDCATKLCTLDELIESTELSNDPRFVLWGEVVTLAHLMGEPAGALAVPMGTWLRACDQRRARCAVGIAATRSVRIRSRWVRRYYDTFALERAVADAMAEQLNAAAELGRPSSRWQIGIFRWADVRRLLDAECVPVKQSTDPYGTPPDWAARGLHLDGRTWAEIRESLNARDLAAKTPFTPTFFGEPAILDEAASSVSGGDTRRSRLDGALKGVLKLPTVWPSHRLYPPD